MTTTDFSTTLVVDQTPKEVFDAINNVRGWWTNVLEGSSQKLNDVFTVRFFDDVHVSTQKLVEVIPREKVVWLVIDSRLNFIEDIHEWTNTKISFDISRRDDQTRINFTHFGLAPNVQCYNDCVKGWTYYLGSLFKLITEGKGTPELK